MAFRKMSRQRKPDQSTFRKDTVLVPDFDDPRIARQLDCREMPLQDVDDEIIKIFRSMKSMDELQFSNGIVILAHSRSIMGNRAFSTFDNEVVGAIRSLKNENVSPSMIEKLRLISAESPNELARAAARKKLESLKKDGF